MNSQPTDMVVEPVKLKKITSPKSKLKIFLYYILGFYLGLHAFYAGKYKRGIFYIFSISGIFIYYVYILYMFTNGWLTSWLKMSLTTWFLVYSTFNMIIQHIPFLGWTAYFGTYLIYLFAIACILIIWDGILILLGEYRDADNLKIVRQKKKNTNQI